MGKIILILGGVRSGKSTFATKIAKESNKKVAYIATSPYFDGDMTERIEQHKKDRPKEWETYEEQKEIPELLRKIGENYDLIIIECLTLFVSNFLLDDQGEEIIHDKASELLDVLEAGNFNTIIVSNEVGLGIHPENQLGRKYRDIVGRLHQMIASKAQDVFYVFAGVPVNIKHLKTVDYNL